ncbi:MAG: 30S ribosomal protein S12 methylthiotransferase RimO [Eubacteriaceae bacterium]|nr:30S ribosomal protein S12 methylthiotransferase RimO [Eubacteriaceae bacterium]MDD4507453.1 30S ribosomal protein S12 methylthiotransferase RimO [Eubacteriaceae bacterium]
MDNYHNVVYIKTLGCDKNSVDSEEMLGSLLGNGFKDTDDPYKAGIIIINTCCFIEDAKKESIDTIFNYLPLKNEGHCYCFIVTGCMAERYAGELKKELPEVDYFVGVNRIAALPVILKQSPLEKIFIGNGNNLEMHSEQRYIANDRYTAYLKISDGCDHRCTYCVIPKIRGKHHSREIRSIVNEAQSLYDHGVKELILVAQDLTQYGSDLDQNYNLATLLKVLSETIPFRWIRLLYLYPEGINQELLQVIKSHSNICHYFDMPIQHTENDILKRMGRHIDKAQIYDKVNLIRQVLPDAILRTTIITGFPGETNEIFSALLKSLNFLKFDRLGVFTYSREEGTPAYSMAEQLEEKTKLERQEQIYELQHRITVKANQQFIGETLEVLIDECQEDHVCIGRTQGDAPEVDCNVIIENADLREGQFYQIKINEVMDFDLIGEEKNEFTK